MANFSLSNETWINNNLSSWTLSSFSEYKISNQIEQSKIINKNDYSELTFIFILYLIALIYIWISYILKKISKIIYILFFIWTIYYIPIFWFILYSAIFLIIEKYIIINNDTIKIVVFSTLLIWLILIHYFLIKKIIDNFKNRKILKNESKKININLNLPINNKIINYYNNQNNIVKIIFIILIIVFFIINYYLLITIIFGIILYYFYHKWILYIIYWEKIQNIILENKWWHRLLKILFYIILIIISILSYYYKNNLSNIKLENYNNNYYNEVTY